MGLKNLKIAWPILLLLSTLLPSCDKIGLKVEIPAIEWCSSIGKFGAICQDSLDVNTRRRMTVDEWVVFLAAKPKTDTAPEKGPALCTSSVDFAKLQTALDRLCYKAGQYCTLEQKKIIASLKTSVENLQSDALKITK